MTKQILEQLHRIENLLLLSQKQDTVYFEIDEASNFLKLKKATLYQMVFKREIPFYKSTKKLLFKKSDLIDWVDKDRIYTVKELEVQLQTRIN